MVTKEEMGQGRDKLGIWDQQTHMTVYRINNKVLLYSTRNYIPYPVINNKKEYEKKYIYMNHFAIYQKLTQYFKSTIVQLKKKSCCL